MNNKGVQISILMILVIMVGLAFYNRDQLPALSLIAITAFTLALLIPIMLARFGKGRTLSIDALEQELKNNANLMLLDVRSVDDYQGELGHIDGSINIPLEQLAQRLSDIDSHLDKPIAIICSKVGRSKQASHLLTRNGFTLVYVVKGGIKQWQKTGLPLNQSQPS